MSAIRKYQPSSGTAGSGFFANWCENCQKDAVMNGTKSFDDADDGDLCQILADTMAYNVDDPEYPSEWQYGKDGHPVCTAFVQIGEVITIRCEATVDMFDGPADRCPCHDKGDT